MCIASRLPIKALMLLDTIIGGLGKQNKASRVIYDLLKSYWKRHICIVKQYVSITVTRQFIQVYQDIHLEVDLHLHYLSIKYPDLFKVIIQNAPFVAYNTPSGKLPNHRDVDSVVKFYPTIELMPNPKMPLLFMEKFYEDEYQVR